MPKLPKGVVIPKEKVDELFKLTPEQERQLDELADWRARSLRADIYIGGPG